MFNNLMNIGSLLKFQGRPLVGRVKVGFMKLNFKMAFPREKSDLPLPKEVLSKGGFMKFAPEERRNVVSWVFFSIF